MADEQPKPDLSKIHLALITPGNMFSRTFLECYTKFVVEAMTARLSLMPVMLGGSFIPHIRQNSLCGSATLGPFQGAFSTLPPGNPMPTHTLWIDSDMVFTFQDFLTLLSRDKDYISGLFKLNTGEHFSAAKWSISSLMKSGRLPFLTEATLPSTTEPFLTEITGQAFTLIKAGVYKKIPYPWFAPVEYNIAGSKMVTGEDIGFCLRLKEAGIEVWVDPTVRIGHEKLRILL